MEASAFTPWLLENAGVLGDALGIDLELNSSEHKVGGFSLDLVGRDLDNDEVVIIENQFGATDHRHLGQLLTYAGGTEPSTIVWIAEVFREEHRAALDWLNLRTDSDARFFGVQLRAVTIEGAPSGLVAPLFDVVAKPNEWGKAVKGKGAGPTSEREELYFEFWSDWLTEVAGHNWTSRKAPAKHWLRLPSGSPKARYTVSFRSDGLLSELFFSHPNPAVNLSRWEVLAAKRSEIEDAYGAPLIFDDLPTRKGCRVGIARTGGESVEDRSAWRDYAAWFEETQSKLRASIAAVGGIPPLMGDFDNENDDLDDE
jgi:hypothetical protein